MHSKIIQPQKQGRKAYDNKGSCASLIHYLGHEAKEHKVPFSFFNANHRTIPPQEVLSAIDHNVKGLRKNEVKFYSLILSPSQSELGHLETKKGNNTQHSLDEKLKQFTCQTMENYASNFRMKNDKTLSSSDLVWFAVIHQDRQFKGIHQQVKNKEAISGEKKPGMNAHIHVIVSKRDISQKISLNPQGSKACFEMIQWQKQNEQSFDQLFVYPREVKQGVENKGKLTSEQVERLDKRIDNRLSLINGMLEEGDKLSPAEVKQIAQKKSYRETFFYNLSRLEKNIREGKTVYDPLHLLAHNKDRKDERLASFRVGAQLEKTLHILSSEKPSFTEDLSTLNAKPRFRRHLNQDANLKKARLGYGPNM